jgi:membrane-bound lytic murein transglycosylase MltF
VAFACAGADGELDAATPDNGLQTGQESGQQSDATDEVVSGLPADEDPLLYFASEAARDLRLDRKLTGDLDAILERGFVRVLVVYSRTNYFMDGPRQGGATYEALKLFEDFLNERYARGALKINVIPVPVARAQLFDGLVEGTGDIAAANITVTNERQLLVDFGDPFISDVQEIVVTGPAGPPLRSLEDLAGKTVYVRESSSYYDSLLALNERLQAAGHEPVVLELAEDYLEDEDLLEMVDAGLLETIIVDQYKAELWDKILDNLMLHTGLAVRTDGRIAWAIRQDSPQLAALINEFVARNKKGTLMGNIILNRYFRDTKRVRNAFGDEARARYRDVIGHFEEYAAQYDFDYLMVAAQGFQESELDQSRVSHRGALGVMQLLPSTAADKSVGIPDISTANANIHAGIRYMRWIRDTYFDDPAIDDLNKTLLSFASYNAGPNRIARLRTTAAERGLDPNVWYRNVEIIAAEKIGRETVDYVAHIYKYYAAYRMNEVRRQQRESR